MSVIHFKFRSATDYEVVSFEGSSVSLKELNDLIIAKKKMSKAKDFKLEISNESTKQVYVDENIQIPKNSTVIVRRLPIDYVKPVIPTNLKEHMTVEQLSKIGNLATAHASEENKIQAMMIQSKMDDVFAASLPDKQRTPICYHCKAQGHVIRSCPLLVNQSSMISGTEPAHVFLRNTLGLPSVEEKKDVNYANSLLAMSQIPDFLKCPQCSQLLDNAVLVPCCGTTFCEGCAGSYLDLYKVCPNCKKPASNIEPIENVSMRKSVKSFKSTKCGFSTMNNAPSKLASEPIISQGVSSGNSATQLPVDTGSNNAPESSSVAPLAEPPAATPVVAAQQSFPFGMMNPLMGMLFNPFAAMAAAVAQNSFMGAAMRMQAMPNNQSSMSREMYKKNEAFRKEPKLQNLLHGACVLQKDDFYTLQSGMKERLRELNVSPSRYHPHQSRKHESRHHHYSRNHNGSSRSNRNGATSPDKQQHSSSRYHHRDKRNDDNNDHDAHHSSKIKKSDNRYHDSDDIKYEPKKSRSQNTTNTVDETKYGGDDDQKKIEHDIRENRSSRKRSRSKNDKDSKRRSSRSDKVVSTVKSNEKHGRDSDRSGRKNHTSRSRSRSHKPSSCSSQHKKTNPKRKLENDCDEQAKLSDPSTKPVFDRSNDKALVVTKRPKIVINV